MINVKLKPLHPKLGSSFPFPKQMSELAAGWDVVAALDESVTLMPLERKLVPCGFALEIPPGYEVQVRPRSGLAAKHGVTVANAPGTIDADYRGEVKVLLVNLGAEGFVIHPGERIAQLVFAPVTRVEFTTVDVLGDTMRGQGGFGSTGR